MKAWKIVVVVVIVLLVVALGFVTNYALEDKGIRKMNKEIKTYRVVEERDRLLMEIMQHKVEIARLQPMFNPKDPNGP